MGFYRKLKLLPTVLLALALHALLALFVDTRIP